MKIVPFVLAACFVVAAFSQAQTPPSQGGYAPQPYIQQPYTPPPYYGGYPYSYHASTAGEGYARGIGDVIRSWGQYNLSTSAAAINYSEARRRQIDNDVQWTNAYFQMREINKRNRDEALKRRRGSPSDWIRYAQAGKPKRPSNSDLDSATGEIHWPIALTLSAFDSQRAEVQKLFAVRAHRGVLSADEFLEAQRLIGQMTSGLKDRIKSFPPQQYVTGKQFLEGLSYEAGQPAG